LESIIMPDSIVIRGGRVIDPSQEIDSVMDVALVDGRIAALGASIPQSAEEEIDARGLIVSPGLIDMHVHLREPGGEDAETIASGSAAAVAGGFTAVACMPNTHPAIDSDSEIQFVRRQARRVAACRVYPFGALTKNRAGEELAEMGLMKQAGAVGFTDDGCGVADAGVCYRAMAYVAMLDSLFAQHCEEPSLSGGCMNAGPVATRLGLPGVSPLSEEVMIERDIRLARATGVRYHVQHLSTAGAVDLIRQARQRGDRVTAEACPHHLLLTDESCSTYDTRFKMNPPLRTRSDVDAVIAGVADGSISVLVTDHAPHSAERKALEFQHAPFGITGLEWSLALFIEALVIPGHIDWSRLIAMMSTNQAELLNVSGGTLRVGSPADVTLIDPELEWTIRAEESRSLSRNTPFDQRSVKGRAVRTIVAGRTVFNLSATEPVAEPV
jgi:dihydroorotase